MRVLFGGFAAVFLATAGFAAAQAGGLQHPPPRPPLVISSMVGRDLFQFYCATCHGADAKGSGPVAAALKTAPADLTRISSRNGGRFPHDDLVRFVSNGEGVPAHGPQDMPVWGPIFRALDPSDVRASMRVENLVSYLESIQER